MTYVDGGEPRSALVELEQAEKRRGEATAVFLDDVPTFRYLAPLPYWLGRAHEGINSASPAAADNYRKFLALRPTIPAIRWPPTRASVSRHCRRSLIANCIRE